MTEQLKRFKTIAILIALYGSLSLFLILLSPRKLPIVLLIVPFILLFAAIALTTASIVHRFFPGVEKPKRKFYGIAVASLPTLLLMLSSINQLTWRDAVLMGLLIVSLLFYASRINFLNR